MSQCMKASEVKEAHSNFQHVRLCHTFTYMTYRNTKEVGLIHDIEHHFSHFAVVHSEVVVGVLPLFYPEQFHHASEGFSNDPDPVIGKAMKLAGLHTFLLKLSAVLPLVLLRGLSEVKDSVGWWIISNALLLVYFVQWEGIIFRTDTQSYWILLFWDQCSFSL